MKPEAPRDLALDGVRGLAVLLVILHHVVIFGSPECSSLLERIFFQLGAEGWAGVDLFFVLSGFLITRILLGTKSRENYFVNFYARRTLRIFPLYYLFVALFFLAVPRFLGAAHPLNQERAHQLWYWLYLPNLRIFLENSWVSSLTDHTWSLAVEEQFYLVWPWLVYLLSEKALLRFTGVLFGASVLLRAYLVFHGHSVAAVRAFTPVHLDGLMLGAALAILFRQGHGAVVNARSWGRLSVTLLGFSLALRVAVSRVPADWAAEEIKRIATVSLWSAFFTGLLAKVISSPPHHPLQRAFRLRPLTFLGTYSYGLYLFHQPIVHGFAGLLEPYYHSAAGSWLLLLLIPVPLSVLSAWLLYRYFEMPFLAQKERFSTQR